MSDQLKIYCKNTSRYENIEAGETLAQIYSRLSDTISMTPICALVNNKTESMNYAVFSPKQVEFFDIQSKNRKKKYIPGLYVCCFSKVSEMSLTMQN